MTRLRKAKLHTVTVASRQVRTLEVGEGPPVLCSSGVASNISDWLLLAEQLPDYRLIIFDRPGYAPGDLLIGRPFDLLEEAGRYLAVAQSLGITEGLTAVGHSMGAYVIEAALRLQPGLFSSAMALDGSTLSEGNGAVADARHRARLLMPTLRSDLLAYIWAVAGPTTMLAGALGRLKIWRRYPRAIKSFAAPEMLTATVRELLDFNHAADQLAQLRRTHPLNPELRLGIYPSKWAIDTRGNRRWLDAVLAEAKLLSVEVPVHFEVITPAGHFVMIDAPEQVAQQLRALTTGQPLR